MSVEHVTDESEVELAILLLGMTRAFPRFERLLGETLLLWKAVDHNLSVHFSLCPQAELAFLRKRGVRVVIYLDDFLLLGFSVEETQKYTEMSMSLLESLEFIINKEKSILIPTQVLTWDSRLDSLFWDSRSGILVSGIRFWDSGTHFFWILVLVTV